MKMRTESFVCSISSRGLSFEIVFFNMQIISLGAGFDSAFFRLQSSGHLSNTTFYEVDFPDVVRRKATIIKGNEELRKLLLNVQNVESNAQSGESPFIHLLT